MKVVKRVLRSKEQTGKDMHDLVSRFNGDLESVYIPDEDNKYIRVCNLPISEYFDLVRLIPYRQDVKPVEVTARPIHIWRNAMSGMDCKKKAILIASWAKYNRVPYRLIASSVRKDKKITHVYPEIFLNGNWTVADATYKNYCLSMNKNNTRQEILQG